MMLMERNYCFKRSKWLAKRTHVGDDDGGGSDNDDDGDYILFSQDPGHLVIDEDGMSTDGQVSHCSLTLPSFAI